MSKATPPRSRPGPAPTLSMGQILDAALAVLDAKGAQTFNMRALASQLNTSPMTVYNYIPTKAALLDAVVDHVIDAIAVPDPAAPAWDAELRAYALASWRVLSRHAWLPALLAERHVPDRPAQLAARAALLDLFEGAGADRTGALECAGAFFSFMLGSFMQVRPTASDRNKASDRADALFAAGLAIVIDGIRVRVAGSG